MVRPIVAAAILISICLSCIGGQDVVKMGTEGAYPPYNVINEDGEVDGFERELGDELCRRANLECVWVTNEWDTIIPNLLAGDYDTIMAGMSITDERDETIDFTQPYFPPSPSVYIARAGAGDEAAAGKVAAQVSTVQADHLSESGATLQEYELGPGGGLGRPERRGGCRAGRSGVRPGERGQECGKADYRRPQGDVGHWYRRRRPRVRWRVEGQAGPSHRGHESRTAR